MAIIGSMDLGIGDISPAAYIHLVSFIYNPKAIVYNADGTTTTVPEIEIEIHTYHSKAARNLHIIKDFVTDFVSKNPSLDPIKLKWLQDNILSRAVRPLQMMKWATRDLSSFTEVDVSKIDSSIALPYFYSWIKKNPVMGLIGNPQDDIDTSKHIIDNFISQHPEIFSNG